VRHTKKIIWSLVTASPPSLLFPTLPGKSSLGDLPEKYPGLRAWVEGLMQRRNYQSIEVYLSQHWLHRQLNAKKFT
jgi:hypothetical protein